MDNFEYLFAEILVYCDHLEGTRAFNNGNLGYITYIFDNNYDSIFIRWGVNNYNEITEFIKKLCVCPLDIIKPQDLITCVVKVLSQ